MGESEYTGEKSSSPGIPIRICILVGHDANRRLLTEWLTEFEPFEVETEAPELDSSIDLCIVDPQGLAKNRSEISDWKSETEVVFTPCLFASEEEEHALSSSDSSLIDEVVELPVGKAALERQLRRLFEQREQSIELDRARQTLRTQNERLQTFAGRLAHDLRNPLGIVAGYVDEVRNNSSNHQESFTAIEAGLDRMRQLIDESLQLAKMGQTVLESEPVTLRTTAERAWKNVETSEAFLQITDDTHFEADSGRLVSLFENLYRNSVEHVGPGVSIEVGPLQDGFYITDDGPGIPESARDQVFEAGYSTNENGTGFGLRIVWEIIDAHGWTVSIVEKSNGGTRYEISGVVPTDE